MADLEKITLSDGSNLDIRDKRVDSIKQDLDYQKDNGYLQNDNILGLDKGNLYKVDLKQGEKVTIAVKNPSEIQAGSIVKVNFYDANKTVNDYWTLTQATQTGGCRTVTLAKDATYASIDTTSNLEFGLFKGTVTHDSYVDYIYPNTKIAELNSNLDSLAYGEYGAKNKFKVNDYYQILDAVKVSNDSIKFTNANYEVARYYLNVKQNTTYTVSYELALTSGSSYVGIAKTSANANIKEHRDSASGKVSFSFNSGSETRVSVAFGGSSATSTGTFSKVQIEEGSVATAYEPYVMSNKQLTKLNQSLSKNTLSASGIVTLTSDTEYTCPSDGYFRITVGATAGRIAGKINDVTVFAASQANDVNSLFVRKGTKVSFAKSSSTNAGYFIPLN